VVRIQGSAAVPDPAVLAVINGLPSCDLEIIPANT
jgi:hypothetical protein